MKYMNLEVSIDPELSDRILNRVNGHQVKLVSRWVIMRTMRVGIVWPMVRPIIGMPELDVAF